MFERHIRNSRESPTRTAVFLSNETMNVHSAISCLDSTEKVALKCAVVWPENDHFRLPSRSISTLTVLVWMPLAFLIELRSLRSWLSLPGYYKSRCLDTTSLKAVQHDHLSMIRHLTLLNNIELLASDIWSSGESSETTPTYPVWCGMVQLCGVCRWMKFHHGRYFFAECSRKVTILCHWPSSSRRSPDVLSEKKMKSAEDKPEGM